MPEYEIDEQLKKYWEIVTRQLSTEEQQTLEAFLEEDKSVFQDATQEHPVKAVVFASWLQTDQIIEILKPSYPYFDLIKDRFHCRMRFFAYFSLSKRKNVWQVYHSLSDEEYHLLGFKVK